MKKITSLFLTFILIFGMVPTINVSAEANLFSVLGQYVDVAEDASAQQEEIFAIDSNGKYVYAAGRYFGMRIYDIQDRSNPVDVTPDEDIYKGTCTIDVTCSVKVTDKYLYVGFSAASPKGKAGKGVRKYSLENPAKPEYICTYDVAIPVGIEERNDVVYIADRNSGVKIFKGNSTSPVKTYYSAAAGILETMLLKDDMLYVAGREQLIFYSFVNDTNLYKVAVKTYEKTCNPKAIAVNDNGIYMACAQGFMLINLDSIGGDLSGIDYAQSYLKDMGLASSVFDDIFLKDNYVYLSGSNQFVVLDVSDVSNIQICVSGKNANASRWIVPLDDCMVGSMRYKAEIKLYSYGTVPAGKSFGRENSEVVAEKKQDLLRIDPITFKDIKSSSYRESIEAIAEAGIIEFGVDMAYRPNDNLTYAEWSKMLAALSGYSKMEYDGSIEQITGDEWFADYANAISKQGLLKLDGKELGGNITRGDIALSAYNMLKKLTGDELEPKKRLTLSNVTEEETLTALSYLSENKLLNIKKDFDKDSAISRGEAADFVNSLLKHIEKNEIDRTSFKQVPIILSVSDAVVPGDAFNIRGEGLDENTKVYIAPITDDVKTYTKPNDAQELKILSLDTNAQYLTAFMPNEATAGTYNVWVENSYGTSINYNMNATRTLWMEWDRVSSNSDILVSGRNFLASEFGASNDDKTAVRLMAADGTTYPAIILTKATCGIRFTVGEDVPYGDYVVQTTNDGIIWSSLEDQIEGGVLKVEAPSYDPYDLDVAWAKEYNFTNKVNVKDFGAVGDGSVYDTDAINAAINAVADEGGVVYFPEGTYKIESIKLPGYVVLEGAGMDKTKLLYRANIEERDPKSLTGVIVVNSDQSRRGKEGRQGLVNLWIDEDKSVGVEYRVSQYYWLGHGWITTGLEKKTAKYAFVKGCRIGSPTFDWNDPKYYGSDGLGTTDADLFTGVCIAELESHYLVEDCFLNGDSTGLTSTYMEKYASVKNNKADTISGNFYMHLTNTIYENNDITRAPWHQLMYGNISRQGIYTRHNTYVDNNTITNSGAYTRDGEVIAIEDYNAGIVTYGTVNVASSDSVKLNVKQDKGGFFYGAAGSGNSAGKLNLQEPGNWDMDVIVYPRLCIVIAQGKGLGQVREVESIDKYTRTVKLKESWDVIPDSTSKFILYVPTDNIAITNNELINCQWSILLYAACNDVVVSGNTGDDMMGISAYIIKKESLNTSTGVADCRARQMFGVRVSDNHFTGYSWKNQRCAITLDASIETKGGAMNGYYYYDWIIKNNSVVGEDRRWSDIKEGILAVDEMGQKTSAWGNRTIIGFDGIQIRNNIWDAVDADTLKQWEADGGGIHAIVMDGNHVGHTEFGITIGGNGYEQLEDMDTLAEKQQYLRPRGLVIKESTFESVSEPMKRFKTPSGEYMDKDTVYVNNDGEIVDIEGSYTVLD